MSADTNKNEKDVQTTLAAPPTSSRLGRIYETAVELLELMAQHEPLLQPSALEDWRVYMNTTREFIAVLEGQVQGGDSTSVTQGELDLVKFGQLLRLKREAAGLSRAKLAKRARLSEATIKLIEGGRHRPSRATLLRLIQVEVLGLSWEAVSDIRRDRGFSALMAQVPPTAPSDPSPNLNWCVTEGFDAITMVRDLSRFLRGAGGYVEQSAAYLDHHSASDYLRRTEQHGVTSRHRSNLPFPLLAKTLIAHSSKPRYLVVALGPGDGTLETRFTRALAEEMREPDIDLCLLDISQPLLNTAYRHAVDMLENQSGVHVWAMQGNFHNLSSYEQLNYPPANNGRHRVFCALGFTLGNLDNEARFLRDNLSAVSQPGDFLLLDIQLSAGASEPEIRRKEDHAFTKPFPESTKRWLSGPIQRACPDALDIQFQMELDTAVPIQGSYALCAIATVKRTGRADRRFSMFRFKRYDQAKLEQVLDEIGWELIASPAVPDSPGSAVLLLRRRALSLPAPK